jgi:hypothetical protein
MVSVIVTVIVGTLTVESVLGYHGGVKTPGGTYAGVVGTTCVTGTVLGTHDGVGRPVGTYTGG